MCLAWQLIFSEYQDADTDGINDAKDDDDDNDGIDDEEDDDDDGDGIDDDDEDDDGDGLSNEGYTLGTILNVQSNCILSLIRWRWWRWWWHWWRWRWWWWWWW